MTFLPQIPRPKELIRSAVEKAKKRARQTYGKNKEATKKKRELVRVEVLAGILSNKLENIVKESASFDNLPPFYREIISASIDLSRTKRSLAVIGWLGKKIKNLSSGYKKRIRASDIGEAVRLRKQFEARVEDMILGQASDFSFLRDASIELARLPKIKDMPTVIIAGYPNVGKSSILKALTGSPVKIKSYPFTTKRILIGYANLGYKELQIIDTPGVLDRPLEKANRIERKALAALFNLSGKVLFVVDPSETCGFPLENQLSLLDSLRKRNLDILVVSNKADIAIPDFECDLIVSALSDADMGKLKEIVFRWALEPSKDAL